MQHMSWWAALYSPRTGMIEWVNDTTGCMVQGLLQVRVWQVFISVKLQWLT